MANIPSKKQNLSKKAVILIAILSVLWGVNFTSIKVAVSEFPPWTFRVICVTCGAIGLLGIGHFILGHSIFIKSGERIKLSIAAFLNISGFQICVAFALMTVDSGRGIVIAHTMPLWATMLAVVFLGEKLTLSHCLALILGLIGLYLLAGPALFEQDASSFGVVLLLSAAISWGAGTVVIKSQIWKTPIIILTGWQFVIGGIPMLFGMIIYESDIEFPTISTLVLFAVLYSALVPMLICHLIWYTLIKILPTTISTISTLAIPIIGVFSGSLFLDENIQILDWISLILVVMAIGIVLSPTGALKIFCRDKKY